MKYYKPLTYVVTAAYLSAIAPQARADTPRPLQWDVVQKSKVAAEPKSIDALVLASAETSSEHPKADLGISPQKRKHWWNWFYDNWKGRIASTIILGGIGYGVYAATHKEKKKDDTKTTTPPGTTPTTPPVDTGDDKNPGQ